jgi:signal transduction histidine kinase
MGTFQPMTLHGWVTLVACAGLLALALLAALRATKSPLAMPLAGLCMVFFSWNLAVLALRITGDVGWHYLDVSTSPFTAVVALHFFVAFVGRRRQLTWVLGLGYLGAGALGATSAVGAFWAPLAAFGSSPLWAGLHLGGALVVAGYSVCLLVVHLKTSTDPEEQMRTWLVLGALAVAGVLGCTELFADLGLPVPRGGAVGALFAVCVLSVVVFRLRLFGDELSSRVGIYALGLGALAIVAYLGVFYFFAASFALLALGTIMVTLLLLGAVRRTLAALSAHKQRIEAFAALGRFSAQMAHDLKNPLAALKGAVQYLKEEHNRGREIADLGEFLDLLKDQIDRVHGVVDKYQRLSRIQPELSSVSINDVVKSVLALQSFAADKPVRVEADLDPTLVPQLADRDLVVGALDNLVRNAIEAMPSGGQLTVRTERGAGPLGTTISVEDTGEGMDARVREAAFDEFFTTKASGGGLGLSFVRRVAEAHGGSVSLSTLKGRGTVVRVHLPA